VSRFRFIAAVAPHHSVALSCRVLNVSRAGFYAWRGRPPSARAHADEALTEVIHMIHHDARGTYGSPRIHAELRATGRRCGRKRVARLMRQAGLVGCHRRRRQPRTTVADPVATPAPDLLRRDFTPLAPDRVWLADITYVPTGEGWLYLATVLDAFSRRVVGWAMADHLRTELVLGALEMALGARRPAAGLIHHSDRGCQYTSLAFGQRLHAAGHRPSMSRRANCWDNAVAESFFATLKGELVDRQPWPTRAAARLAIFDYLEGFYNRQRRHSTLGYLSPVAYEVRHSPSTVEPVAKRS
jgi:putative transposase